MSETQTNSAAPATASTAPTTASTAPMSADHKQAFLKEIGTKWNKFSPSDLSALKDKDDLVTQLVSKYSHEKAHAQREVETLLNGRQF
jgi:cupin superfamily acireductone dioxygenase involved in methionine salvage